MVTSNSDGFGRWVIGREMQFRLKSINGLGIGMPEVSGLGMVDGERRRRFLGWGWRQAVAVPWWSLEVLGCGRWRFLGWG